MKSLLRAGFQLVALALVAGVPSVVVTGQSSPSSAASGETFREARAPRNPHTGPQAPHSARDDHKPGSVAVVRGVKVALDTEGPAVEIISSRPLTPTITKLDGPPRLVIDLPHASYSLQRKRFAFRSEQVSAVRIDQFQKSPPITRVVVDLLKPTDYRWDATGNRLMVHLQPVAVSAAAPAPPSAPAFTPGVEPAAVPVSAGSLGVLVQAGRRIATGSSVSAGSDTAILRLARGGEVKVCPGTTVSVTSSQSGYDLMLGMSSGSLEAHYMLDASSDSVLTPDFRILLAGPGEFHYAIRADSQGNTCVSALPGNAASAIVSELMGEGTYQVMSTEQVVFRSGRLKAVDTAVPEDCGCPPPAIPVMRASTPTGPIVSDENLPATMRLAQPGDEAKPAVPSPTSAGWPSSTPIPAEVNSAAIAPEAPLPASEPKGVHVQIDAPFVFRASDTPPPAPTLGGEPLALVDSGFPNRLPATVLAPAAPPPHHGFFGKIKGFFAAVFR